MGRFADMPLSQFLAEAASGAPVPGGGGAAALAGALGAAMASMAANFTVGKPKFAEHDAAMREILATLEPAIASLRDAVDADAEAFSAISAAYKLPKGDDAEKERRGREIDKALRAAMRVPQESLRLCRTAAATLPRLAAGANPNLLSDVEVAALLLRAGAQASLANVLVNARQLGGDAGDGAKTEADFLMLEINAFADATLRAVADRQQKK